MCYNIYIMIKKCEICPRKCKINRENGDIGYCNSGDKVKIALISKHNFEEPCISGKGNKKEGSGMNYTPISGVSKKRTYENR